MEMPQNVALRDAASGEIQRVFETGFCKLSICLQS